ncbi:Hypp2349 [Branchiostoma lanceolatum]|uniref:Hypp2349 protein n=1 Tax=Branchiostoma lanceolatum TaxID=7740 RepID=A0A8K0EPL9_BRALA|nr:Hypp2349 [Branchiostoma lanceolatum]
MSPKVLSGDAGVARVSNVPVLFDTTPRGVGNGLTSAAQACGPVCRQHGHVSNAAVFGTDLLRLPVTAG